MVFTALTYVYYLKMQVKRHNLNKFLAIQIVFKISNLAASQDQEHKAHYNPRLTLWPGLYLTLQPFILKLIDMS